MYWVFLYSEVVTDTGLHNLKVTELNLDHTLLVLLCFCESGNSFRSSFLYLMALRLVLAR